MNAKLVLGSILLLSVAGCSMSTTRTFNVPFADADDRLRELYPSGSAYLTTRPVATQPSGEKRLMLRTIRAPYLRGPRVAIQRNEMTTGRSTILITEGDKTPTRRTEIVLKAAAPGRSEVSVQASKAGKAVLIPPRDKAYEQQQMDVISRALKN